MIVEHGNEIKEPVDNKIIGNINQKNSEIIFKGRGNLLIADGNVTLSNSRITFCGDDAVVFLSENSHDYVLVLDMWRETTAYFGRNTYFNGALHAIVSERKNLIVGEECVLSFGIWLRTADPHILYSAETHKRINPSKSIVIGDHVWIGQNALVLKGSQIGSGSVIAANSVIAGKKVESNSAFAGNPASRIKEGVFFRGNSVHNYTAAQSKKSNTYEGDEYIFFDDGNRVNIENYDKELSLQKTVEDKFEIVKNELVMNNNKGRFYIPKEENRNNRSKLFNILTR